MGRFKWICILILTISLLITSGCNKANLDKDNDTNSVTNTDVSPIASKDKNQDSSQIDDNDETKDSLIRSKLMDNDKKELKEEDFEVVYKGVTINKNTKIEDITAKLGMPEDYEANNRGYISGNDKYRRWNLCYPNYSDPEIRIIVFSEREYEGDEVKDGNSYIVGIYLEASATNSGLVVGDELEKVLHLYGKPDVFDKDTENVDGLFFLRYSKDDLSLDITLEQNFKKVKYIFLDYNMKKSSEEQENSTYDAKKQLKLVMKIFVNLGMDEYYQVLDLDEQSITYSYYNYDNTDKPKMEQKKVAFDKLLEKENEVRKYLFFMYLDDSSKEVKLDMSDDFIEQVENNPDFRAKLGNALNKPFAKKLLNNTITSADIS